MKRAEQKFLTIVRSNTMRSFYAAWNLLDVVSTPVLLDAGNDLINRARYLNMIGKLDESNNANQFANQICGELRKRKVDASELHQKILSNLH